MSRRNRNRLLVPEAREALDRLKMEVVQENATSNGGVGVTEPEDAKYKAAEQVNVPLSHGDNGELTTRQVGKVGGQLGGSMVRRLVELAQQQLIEQQNQDPRL